MGQEKPKPPKRYPVRDTIAYCIYKFALSVYNSIVFFTRISPNSTKAITDFYVDHEKRGLRFSTRRVIGKGLVIPMSTFFMSDEALIEAMIRLGFIEKEKEREE